MSRTLQRILFIEANEDGTVGGSHQALFDLVSHLDRTRYEPVVLFYQDNVFVERLRSAGATVSVYADVRERERAVRRSGTRARKLVEYAATVVRRARLLRGLRIDLIHMNNSPRVGDDDWLPAARLLRIPCIANVMGDARGPTGGRLRALLFRSFDHYLPISTYIAEAMIRAGIPERRMDLVHLGVDLGRIRARVLRSRQEVRSELGVSDDTVLAIMVGNVRHWKGQHVVLAAVGALLPQDRSRLHVVFAGAVAASDQPYMAQLQDTIDRGGLSGSVTFLGGRSDVPDLLNAADIAVHASVLPEPFGLVVVEAMALGKPVIAAQEGGPGEVVTAGSGLTFDPQTPRQLAQILTDLVRNDSLRSTLAAGALERVEQFTAERYATGVQRAYERVLVRAS